MTAILWLKANWDSVLAIYGGVVAVCTTLVKITPSVKDDAILAKVLKVLDFFSTAFLKSDIVKIRKGEQKIAEDAEKLKK
jgi:hypothetical protein